MGSMRASQMKTNVASLAELGEVGTRVLAAVRPQTLEEIDRTVGVSWLPVGLDVELTEAADRMLGRDGLERWSRDSMRKSFDGPLLRHMVEGAVRLFGLEPRLA